MIGLSKIGVDAVKVVLNLIEALIYSIKSSHHIRAKVFHVAAIEEDASENGDELYPTRTTSCMANSPVLS